MINQILNQWTTLSKGVQLLSIFLISHVYFDTSLQDYEINRWVGGWLGRLQYIINM
jgi:hypothetical protein